MFEIINFRRMVRGFERNEAALSSPLYFHHKHSVLAREACILESKEAHNLFLCDWQYSMLCLWCFFSKTDCEQQNENGLRQEGYHLCTEYEGQ